jgi:hypothetical protein
MEQKMTTLQDAIVEIQRNIGTLPGIRRSPDAPPERADTFPFAVSYLGDGDWKEEPAGLKTGLHTIVIEIHVARKDLPRDVTAVMKYAESVPNLIFKRLNVDSLAGTIQTITSISYTFGSLGWRDVDTIGFQFKINGVKVQSAIE